ncbi:MAG: hypothetical protein ABL904_03740 [Hyphomicrobiaceae bacterium]
MGRFTLILFAVWATFAWVQMSELDARTFFWAALLPVTYFIGMLLLSDRERL